MKCERSKKRDAYLLEIVRRLNARVSELTAGGMDQNAAMAQANEEICKPILRDRAAVRR